MNNNDILRENKGKKFDIILSNPPYGKLGYKFLSKLLELGNMVISIQPMGYLTNKKQIEEITKYIDEYGANIEQLNGMNSFDNVKLMQNLGIIYINRNKKQDIIYNGKKYNKSSEITMFSEDEYLNEFNNIIQNIIEDNLDNHLKAVPGSIKYKKKIEENPDENWWCVRVPAIRGHTSPKTNLVNSDYYTIISNNEKELYKILGQYKNLSDIKGRKSSINPDDSKKALEYYFAFNTKLEMNNFYNYIKTDFCRTCYRLVKNGSNVFSGGEFKNIPWFDFSDEHFSKSPKEIDDWLFEKYNISNEIRKHIEEILPDYYNIR